MACERPLARSAPGRRLDESQLQTVLACACIPDAVELQSSGALIAYEIELSSKGRNRRRSVLAAYASSDYERVVWIAPSAQLAALLRTEITDSGLNRFMEVRDELEDRH